MHKKLASFLLLLLAFVPLFSFLFSTPVKAEPRPGYFYSGCVFFRGLYDIFKPFYPEPLDPPLVGPFVADNEWYRQTPCQFYNKVYEQDNQEEIFGERYTTAQVNWIFNSFITLLLSFSEGFAIIGSFGQAPAHTPFLAGSTSFVGEVKLLASKFDLATPVHAQVGGFGFDQISAVRGLWAAARNTAYLIMVILLVVSGFMIMFRVKINPQTAVTVQLMIPRIIITLVAVTFSYAIAGAVIDIIYVVIYFIVNFLGTQGIVSDVPRVLQTIASPNMLSLLDFYGRSIPFILLIGGFIVPVVGGLILGFVAIFLLLRVGWMLLKSYLTVLALIIIGPLQIMLGILPSQAGFMGWLRNLIANASVFIVIPVLFLFNMILWTIEIPADVQANPVIGTQVRAIFPNLGINQSAFGGGNLPTLPLTTPPGLPINIGPLNGIIQWLNNAVFRMILGFVILAVMPKVADMIKDALKSPGLGKYGTAFNEALGPVMPLVGAGRAGVGGAAFDYGFNKLITQNAAGTNPIASWMSKHPELGGGITTAGQAIRRTVTGQKSS